MTEYVPLGLFWGTLALVNAGLAEQKGRSRLAWFLLSLFLGPIATFFIVGMGRPDAPTSSFSDSTQRLRAAQHAQDAQRERDTE